MIPNEQELINFIKSKELVNFSLIAKHFNIQNTTVSDLIKSLEHKKLVDVTILGGSKIVKVRDNKMKKRGQVTTYVILGILIVVALAVTLYLNESLLKSKFEKEAEQITVADEFVPVKNYFDSCISSITLDGANILGLQGGYINIPKDELPVNPVLPFSNRLQIFNNDALEVPYWFYETSNGIQKTQIPSIENMQSDLQDYINVHLNDCLENFTEFQDYEVTNFDNVKTEVTIEDSKIFVRVLSKLTVSYKGLVQEFDKFVIISNTPLGKLYNKAKEILDKENTDYFFEQKTIDMLVLYDQIPYHGISLDCSPRVWVTENVKKDLKEVLKTNIEVVNPSSPQKYFTYNINNENVNVNFKYEGDWPLSLDINGGEQILKEQSVYGENNPAANFLRTLFCLNNYQFVYDIKYPILVTLNENNFDFQYATMVIIDNNQPRINRLGTDAPLDSNPIICKSASVNTLINAVDQETNSPVSNAKVEFSCVGTTCNLGETNNEGLTTKVPACLNAIITVNKQGYVQAKTTIDTTQESNLFLYLKPKYKKNIDVKVISENGIRSPLDSEFVSFTLTNLDNETQVSFNEDVKDIELTEGEYEVSSYIIREYANGIKLDKQQLQYCTQALKGGVLGLFGFTETKCAETEIPETTLDKVLTGGANFRFTLTKDQIKNSNSITFYTMFNKVPNNIQELNDLYNLINQNQNSTSFIYPKVT